MISDAMATQESASSNVNEKYIDKGNDIDINSDKQLTSNIKTNHKIENKFKENRNQNKTSKSDKSDFSIEEKDAKKEFYSENEKEQNDEIKFYDEALTSKDADVTENHDSKPFVSDKNEMDNKRTSLKKEDAYNFQKNKKHAFPNNPIKSKTKGVKYTNGVGINNGVNLKERSTFRFILCLIVFFFVLYYVYIMLKKIFNRKRTEKEVLIPFHKKDLEFLKKNVKN